MVGPAVTNGATSYLQEFEQGLEKDDVVNAITFHHCIPACVVLPLELWLDSSHVCQTMDPPKPSRTSTLLLSWIH